MKYLIIMLLALSSCLQIDRGYKDLINTWELTHIDGVPYSGDTYQWSFKRDGTMYFALVYLHEYNYDVTDDLLCIHFDQTECLKILELTGDKLVVNRIDADILYKFRALN